MYKIVFLRHWESTWNKENKFTGWTDVDLSEKWLEEALLAWETLKDAWFDFDVAYTSVLKRALKTLNIVLEKMDRLRIPTIKTWHLNERHYGALQWLNKAETAEKYWDEQVLIWRRSYDVPPPSLESNDERFPWNDLKYKSLDIKDIPYTECLKDTIERVLPYRKKNIVPTIKEWKRIIIAAHWNSIRALVKYLDNVSEQDIMELNIPTWIPLVYELDENMKVLNHYYLWDEEKIKEEMAKVANQWKKK